MLQNMRMLVLVVEREGSSNTLALEELHFIHLEENKNEDTHDASIARAKNIVAQSHTLQMEYHSNEGDSASSLATTRFKRTCTMIFAK